MGDLSLSKTEEVPSLMGVTQAPFAEPRLAGCPQASTAVYSLLVAFYRLQTTFQDQSSDVFTC